MKNEIIELTVTNITEKDYGNYSVTLKDANNVEYKLKLHDKIPLNTTIKINTYHHELIETENGIINMKVKQRFQGNQPDKLELELTTIKTINNGVILTLADTTTQEMFKLKVNESPGKVGDKTVLDFNKLDCELYIKCQPHFYNNYSIENWIINGKEN